MFGTVYSTETEDCQTYSTYGNTKASAGSLSSESTLQGTFIVELSAVFGRILVLNTNGLVSYTDMLNTKGQLYAKKQNSILSSVVWGGIITMFQTTLYDQPTTMTGQTCHQTILLRVHLSRGAMGTNFIFIDDNPCFTV